MDNKYFSSTVRKVNKENEKALKTANEDAASWKTGAFRAILLVIVGYMVIAGLYVIVNAFLFFFKAE